MYEHLLCVVSVIEEVTTTGAVTIMSVVSKQPLASSILTLYFPAQTLSTVSVDGVPGKSYQSITYGDFPPE